MENDKSSVQDKIHSVCVQLFIERNPEAIVHCLHPDIYYYCNKINMEIQGKTELYRYLPELCQTLAVYNNIEISYFRLTPVTGNFYNANFMVCFDEEININCTLLFEDGNPCISIKEMYLYWNILVKEEESFCLVPKRTDTLITSPLFCGTFNIVANDNLTVYSCDQKLLSMLGYESFAEFKENVPYLCLLLHPNYKKDTFSEINAFKQYSKDFYSELCLRKKNGDPLWVLAITQKFTLNNFEVINFSCFNFQSQKSNYLHEQNIMNCINGGYGIFIVLENNTIFPIFFNDALYKLLEQNPNNYSYPCPRLIGTNIIPEDREHYVSSLTNIPRDRNKPFNVSFRVMTASGQIKWFQTNSSAVPADENANFYYVYILYTDITNVKQQQDILQHSFEKTKDAQLLCSNDGNWSVYFVNEQALNLLKLEKQELETVYRNNFAELFPEPQKETYIKDAQNQLEKNGFFSFTANLIVDSKIIPIQLTGKKVFSDKNFFILNLYRPNSEQSKVHNLLELENELKNLYQNIPAVIFHCDNRGNLIFANKYFYKFVDCTDKSFGSLYQNKLENICTPESYRNAVKVIIKNIRSKSTKCFFEICLATKYNKNEILLVNATLQYNEQGKLKKICCITSEKSLSNNFRRQHFIEKTKLKTLCQKTGDIYWEYNIQTEECNLYLKRNDGLEFHHYNNFIQEILESNILAEESKAVFIAVHENLKKGIGCENIKIGMYENKENQTWYELTYIVPKNETGYIDICYGIANNITELKIKSSLLDHVASQVKINVGTYNSKTKELKCPHYTVHDFQYDDTEHNMPEGRIEKECIHPDDIEIYRNFYKNLSNEKESSCEIRIKNRSNEFSWVKIALSPLHKDPANFLYIGMTLDITEQKQIENHYNQIINSRSFQFKNHALAKIIYNLTEDKTISLVNNLEDTEYRDLPSASEFIGMQLQYIIPGYYRDQYVENFNVSNFLKKFEQNELQFQFIYPVERGYDLIWISNNITLFKNPDDNNVFASVNCYDITEEISRQVFSDSYFNNQLDFLVQIDTISDNYKFFSASVSPEEYAEFSLTGKFSVDFIKIMEKIIVGEEDKKIFRDITGGKILSKIKQNEKYSVTVKTFRKNRNPQLCYKQFHFYQYSFIPYIICFACTDVTEHYTKEQQKNEMLKQALQIAKTAITTKNAFLASMSHDIRTPMNAILSMTKLALEEKQNPPQTREYLSIINENSNHLLALVNDILEVNKLENGEMEFNSEEFSITEEINKITELLKTSFQEKKQTFAYDISKIIHTHILGDKTKLNRIITNLLSNAQKYTPNYGRIELTVTEHHQQNKDISIYTITVSDTGIGIAPENLHSIFDPFKREKDGTVQKIEGIGLGLSIVKMFVEKQGGSINVISQKNKGSTFTITIPYTTVKNKETKTEEKAISFDSKNVSNLSILIAEDNMINILVLQKLLGKLNVKITVAHNGQEALNIFTQNQDFDIILMDVQMPIMSGIEATKRIRQLPDPKAKEIPIIAVTANAFPRDIKDCLEAGMNAHISKPIKFEELYHFLELYASNNKKSVCEEN